MAPIPAENGERLDAWMEGAGHDWRTLSRVPLIRRTCGNGGDHWVVLMRRNDNGTFQTKRLKCPHTQDAKWHTANYRRYRADQLHFPPRRVRTSRRQCTRCCGKGYVETTEPPAVEPVEPPTEESDDDDPIDDDLLEDIAERNAMTTLLKVMGDDGDGGGEDLGGNPDDGPPVDDAFDWARSLGGLEEFAAAGEVLVGVDPVEVAVVVDELSEDAGGAVELV